MNLDCKCLTFSFLVPCESKYVQSCKEIFFPTWCRPHRVIFHYFRNWIHDELATPLRFFHFALDKMESTCRMSHHLKSHGMLLYKLKFKKGRIINFINVWSYNSPLVGRTKPPTELHTWNSVIRLEKSKTLWSYGSHCS